MKYITKIGASMWLGLGFYRGYKSYEEKENKKNKNIINSIGYGFCGLFVYLNPLSMPLIIYDEYKKLNQYLQNRKN